MIFAYIDGGMINWRKQERRKERRELIRKEEMNEEGRMKERRQTRECIEGKKEDRKRKKNGK
jgi:hypothetical protein